MIFITQFYNKTLSVITLTIFYTLNNYTLTNKTNN